MKFSVQSILIFLAVSVFTITAYHSVGFFHADEHFQIIEFAGLKAGWNNPNNLVWEYHSKIRPTLQPTIAYGLISLFKMVGITDAYTVSFLLREVTGLLLIFALVFFFKQTKRFIQSSKQPSYNALLEGLYLGFLLLIWYVPYLGVRFSSETWSAIFLILAMGCFFLEEKSWKTTFLIGILFGFSFLFRFQIAFALLGFSINYLIFGKEKLKTSLLILTGFLVVVLLGVFVDSWFYGEWVFTPWEYFYTFFKNDILNKQQYNFGGMAWDYYLNKLFHLPTKLIGTLLFLSLAAVLIFRSKSILLWMILGFLLIHMLIAHKEERFLFPIIFFFPLFFVQLFQLLVEYIPKRIALGLICLTSLAILFTSSIGLPVLASNPAGIGRNGTTQFIHTHFGDRPIHLIAEHYSNPYEPWLLNERFYREKNLTATYIDVRGELTSKLLKKNAVNLFVIRDPKKIYYYLDGKNKTIKHRLIHQSVSKYRLKLDKYTRSMNDQEFFYLFELKK